MSLKTPLDDISQLQAILMTITSQMREMIGKSLIECPRLNDDDPIIMQTHMNNATQRMSSLTEDIKKFESIVDSLSEFHKTEEEQIREISELSGENQTLTNQLVSSVRKLKCIERELSLLLDAALAGIE